MINNQTKLNNQDKKWFALYTKPRFEKKVHQALINQKVETYLPLYTTIKQWTDRKKKVELPLIPSYVFVNTQSIDLADVYKINGVLGVLQYLKKPAVVRNFEIENLKILLKDSEKIELLEEKSLDRGESVIVEKGVFKGLIAECIKTKGKHRVIVRLELMENLIEVNVPLSYLSKLKTIES